MEHNTLTAKQRINASQTKYRRKHTRTYQIRFFKNTEPEIIEFLDSIEGSRTDYIRKLIVEDMKKRRK